MSDSQPALSVEDLAKSFDGFRAVDGVSFSVAKGEIVALIGPNGAGKTTTFNLINGQIRPDRGKISLQGRDVTGFAARALWNLGVARTFQITATYPSMTVAENINVSLLPVTGRGGIWGVGRASRIDTPEAAEVIRAVGLQPLMDQLCSTLAYGDLKRVELAMALANRPNLLLMDEPTAGMAAGSREQLMALAVGVARRRNAAILFTEHDMGVVFRHADRVIVMSRGRLIADGTPEAIRQDPRVREVYLGRSPTPTQVKR